MARVRKDWQVAEFLDDGNRRNVERIARVAFERPDAALAEHDARVAAGEDVLGREQPLFDRRGYAAFEKHRRSCPSEIAQQVEALHIACADLQNVRVSL